MKLTYLFGPFVGSLSWEMFYFAPHAIYLKKKYPNCKIIVYTRPDRFDLYGVYADVLVPLRIKNDNISLQNGFGLKGLSEKNFTKMVKMFHRKYKNIESVKKHFYTFFYDERKDIKLQLPSDEMDYSFLERPDNFTLLSNFLPKGDNVLIDLSGMYLDESFYFIEELDRTISKDVNFICYDPNDSFSTLMFTTRKIVNLNKIKHTHNSSEFGCLISSVKKSIFTISSSFSIVSHLSLLTKIKLFLNKYYDEQFLNSINPLNTPIYSNEKQMEKFEI